MVFVFFTMFFFTTSHNNIDKKKCIKYFDETLNEEVYTFVDSMPQYPGGHIEFMRFFGNNYQYQEQEIIQLTFVIEFIVDLEGNFINPQIGGKDPENLNSSELEIIRVLNLMPKWSPGYCKGNKVLVKVMIPLLLSPSFR